MALTTVIEDGNIKVTNDDPVAEAVYPLSILESGHRGLSAQLKRDLGIGPGGKYVLTEQMYRDILAGIQISVPNVVGMTYQDATPVIEAAHLTFGGVIGTVNPIASQNPAAGALAGYLDPVTVTLTS